MEQKFNESQKKAIEFKNGPCLVLSGPGSGKTFVLINRIWTLITKHNINPTNILIITFTRAAANEMKERFEKKLREEEC
ncbi:MAG: UvrD-helicase domain-containing protein, partial [Lachnospiraceae bacterium]|nr:UvrD-helicase domain-containing protein [Lachnospiraceae bacterium]